MHKNGANIHARNDSALMGSSQGGYLNVVKYLVQNGANVKTNESYPIRICLQKQHFEIVTFLLENGENIHIGNDYILCYCAKYGYLEMVKYLVEHGAYIHAQDNLALKVSSEKGHIEIIKYLLHHGANKYVLHPYILKELGIELFKPAPNDFTYIESNECPITRETFDLNDKLACSNCKNIFMKDTIEEWFQRNYTCPMCRKVCDFYII